MICITDERKKENWIQSKWKVPRDYCDILRISINCICWMLLFCARNLIKKVTFSTNMSDIASTKENFFGTLRKFQARRGAPSVI